LRHTPRLQNIVSTVCFNFGLLKHWIVMLICQKSFKRSPCSWKSN
jgi:hypothetical protein